MQLIASKIVRRRLVFNMSLITKCMSGPWGTGTSTARTAARCCSTVCQRRLAITSCVTIATSWIALFPSVNHLRLDPILTSLCNYVLTTLQTFVGKVGEGN